MQCSAREQGQDDDFVREPGIGSWSGEQGVKNQWNAFPKTAKSVANRQTMPRVADMQGNLPVSFGKGATEKGCKEPRRCPTSFGRGLREKGW
jgi:hypothetical protein